MKAYFLFITSILLAVSTGCITRTLTLPNGNIAYKSTSFGIKEQFKSVTYKSTNGESLAIQGYNKDGTEALGVVTEAAVKAALSIK